MNEGKTTAIFAAVAAVSFGLAWWSRPTAITSERDLQSELIGKPIFASFEDPSTATSFQIVKFNEELGQLSRFEIARDNTTNLWRLPSYDDYPADAAEQVRDATTPLIGLNVLNIPTFDRGDHSLYGVINPDDEALSAAETGVGMLVRVKDAQDQIVASLIVGKEVDQAEGQRYVRVPTEDAVYVVELDTNPFSTDFTKWIKGELLGVRGFDITNVELRNYAVLPTQRGLSLRRNFDADLRFDPTTNQWSLDKLLTYEGATATETTLGEDEALQTAALNDLRNAVQDLKIVGVRRKPTGLSADLKAEKSLMENEESLRSLQEQGFFPGETDNGIEIFATAGETQVGTKDGVQYLLRFGEAVATSSDDEEDEDELTGLNRYLLVTTSLDESKFPPPELEPVPESVEEMLENERAAKSTDAAAGVSDAGTETAPVVEETTAPTDADDAESAASDTTEPTNPPNSEEATDETVPDATTTSPEPDAVDDDAPAEAVDDENGDEEDALNQCGPQAEQDASEDSASEQEPDSQAPTTEQPATEQPATENSAGQEPPAVAEEQPPAADAETAEELQERFEFVRSTIAKENQRKIDERNEKIDQARKKVQELNARFADWYYVVSDSGYRKLSLSREQLIGSKSAQSAAPPAFGNPGGGLPPGFPGFPPQP